MEDPEIMKPFQIAKAAQVKGMHDPKEPPLLELMDILVRLASTADDEDDFEILDDVPQVDSEYYMDDANHDGDPPIDGKAPLWLVTIKN